jgi:cell wall-associated NlpC family hydrolase
MSEQPSIGEVGARASRAAFGKTASTPAGAGPVIPVAMILIGGYLAWFGIHYWRDSAVVWPSTPVKDVLQGKGVPAPARAAAADAPVDTSVDAASAGLTVTPGAAATGSAIADDALKYKGAGYVLGGNASSVGDWDCSSFASYVLGHDLGLALPGGKWGDPGFPPGTHGPTTLNYMLFGTGIDQSQVAAGDLIVSTEHMGIAISATEMISAQDEQLGTNVAGFPAGFPAGPPVYRRVSGTAGTGGIYPTPSGNATAPIGA